MEDKPQVSIGMPVFNGQKFLEAKICSILNQTFKDFELIISDNASTDDTENICTKFANEDIRIKYVRHEKNYGPHKNFEFVLEKANAEYFMWTAVDDILDEKFLEKTFQVLSTKTNVAATIGKIEQYEPEIKDKNEKMFRDIVKKLRSSTRPRDTLSINGEYDERIRCYLRKSTCQVIHSLFRTNVLHQSFIKESFLGTDWAIFLNVLKYGELFVIDEILMKEFEYGISGKGIIQSQKYHNHGKMGFILPWYPLTKWCRINLGNRVFIKNIDYFIQLNLEGIFSVLIDIMQRGTKILSRR